MKSDQFQKEKFEITFISQKINDSVLKLKLGVGGIGFNSKLKLIDTLQYSWKSLSDFDKKKLVINIDSILPVLTFTSPVGQQFVAIVVMQNFVK